MKENLEIPIQAIQTKDSFIFLCCTILQTPHSNPCSLALSSVKTQRQNIHNIQFQISLQVVHNNTLLLNPLSQFAIFEKTTRNVIN